MRNESGEIRSAGGIIRVFGPDGPQILLVHRPAYDDWTLPKGKARGDDTDSETALREVEEETGLRCAAGPEMARLHYRDRKDRPKVARFWLMTPTGGSFTPSTEVDACGWFDPARAALLATRSGERDLIKRLGLALALRASPDNITIVCE